jgi:flavodoxin
MKKILICYASTGGNTHIVCTEVAVCLQQQDFLVDLVRVEQIELALFDAYEYVLFASPTYGHGLLELRMERFVYKKGKDLDLSGKKCAVIGLGDPKYDDDYNIESAILLTEFIEQRGGTILCDALKINENPVPQLVSLVRPWSAALGNIISTH